MSLAWMQSTHSGCASGPDPPLGDSGTPLVEDTDKAEGSPQELVSSSRCRQGDRFGIDNRKVVKRFCVNDCAWVCCKCMYDEPAFMFVLFMQQAKNLMTYDCPGMVKHNLADCHLISSCSRLVWKTCIWGLITSNLIQNLIWVHFSHLHLLYSN